MTHDPSSALPVDRAASLRTAFDRSFAERPPTERAPDEDFLAIKLGGAAYALRLSEISGVFTDKIIVRAPTPLQTLLGIVGIRSTIFPVYDLAALMGQPHGQNPRAPILRWLIVAAHAPFAFAFETFESHVRFRRDRIFPVAPAPDAQRDARQGAWPYVRDIATSNTNATTDADADADADTENRPIVHLPSIVAAIQQHAQERTPHV